MALSSLLCVVSSSVKGLEEHSQPGFPKGYSIGNRFKNLAQAQPLEKRDTKQMGGDIVSRKDTQNSVTVSAIPPA